MRIAYTLNGLIGGFNSGKNMTASESLDYNNQSLLTLRYTSKYPSMGDGLIS